MRSQVRKTERNTLIVDAYNANPSSMQVAIANFAKLTAAKKVLIVGDMLELGKSSEEEHRKVIDQIKAGNYQKVLLVGRSFSELKPGKGFQCFKDTDSARAYLVAHPLKNTTILLKGSRGIGLEKLIDLL
jgi:UDP-N-acetylmuramoyl-tripeptide--D-alanyl-D-alanine ligase